MIHSKLLSIFISLSLLVNAIIIRNLIGTWLFPACLYSVLWFLYTFIPLILLFGYQVNISTMLYIYICTILFSLGSICFDWGNAYACAKKRQIDIKAYSSKFMIYVFISCSILSTIFIIINVLVQGITIIDILTNFLGAAGQFASLRYKDEITRNIYGQLSLLLSNITSISGGMLYGNCKTTKYKIAVLILSFIPSIGIMVFQSAKGLFFLSVSFFIGSLIVIKLLKNDYDINIRYILIKVMQVIAIVFPIVTISFLSRGLQNVDDSNIIIDKLKSSFLTYSCGHIYAFSDWFSFYVGSDHKLDFDSQPLSYGFYTFMTFFRMLGNKTDVPMGIYDEFLVVDDILFTNIYTIYRGIITDFGLIGSLVYMFLWGLICHFIYYTFLKSKNPSITSAMLIFMSGYFYISYIISILTWNVIPVTFAVVAMLIHVNNKLHVSKL